MVWLRFLMLLSLIVWLGGIIFFSILAPNAFAVLPSRELAGSIVNRMLPILHWMGVGSGLVYLVTSLLYSYLSRGAADPLAPRHVLIVLMIVLTLVSQFGVVQKMAVLRADMGVIDAVPHDDPRRIEFNHLHMWSTRLEQAVFICGLAVLYFTARRLS